jgi:endonuclease YncB( thermonuclease family)
VLERGDLRAVTRVVDGQSLVLDDGTEVKLAGILAPRALDVAGVTPDWPPEREAVAALGALALGRTVSIHPIASRTDRYGRRMVHAFVVGGGGGDWLQGRLLSLGHARALSLGDDERCADELLAHERFARTARIGLWANAAYQDRPAYRTRELLRLRSTFQSVSGRVRKVAETKGAIYLNFGTDWLTDFTAGVRTTRTRSGGANWHARLAALEGRRVRVRGWIERRNGPYIEIARMTDIEEIDPPDTARPSDERRAAASTKKD